MAQEDIRIYEVRGRSTETFGRVLCSARTQHFVVDGPVQNGCPGEAITPAEVFLSGVAACGVELVQVLASKANIPLKSISVDVAGMMDRSKPLHPQYTIFQQVRVRFRMSGVDRHQAEQLVEGFKGR